MNYFKTIKAALGSSFDGICRHLRITPTDAYDLIQKHLATMRQEWFTGETPNIVYSDPLCRFAYLYCHTAANANLCEVAIRKSADVSDFLEEKLTKEGEIAICAFGGGPGTELLALSKHLLNVRSNGPHSRISFTLLDKVTEWAESWNALETEINRLLKERYGQFPKHPFSICKTFVPYDMTEGGSYTNLTHLLKHDLYIMNYVVSELIGDYSRFQALVNAAAGCSPIGSKFLIVDRDQDRVINDAKRLLQNAGLSSSEVKKSCCNMDGDEQADVLHIYTSKINRRPRVQWGSGSGRGAFFIVGTKEA